jgi:hypothetical protein
MRGYVVDVNLDNNIYLNDAKINNTKDLATTIGHETSHAMDDQDQQDPDNNFAIFILHLSNLIITIIAIGVLFIGNGYNYIWIGKRFFQSFLSGFTVAISTRTKILSLALINPYIILIITLNKLCVSLCFCWCVA